MTTEQESALKLIYQRAGRNPESAWVNADDISPQTLMNLITSLHIRQNAIGAVRLMPAGLVVARRPHTSSRSQRERDQN